jgi:hypothetical protein
MTTMLEHFKPCKMPSTTHVSICFPIAPTMQAIVVDRVPIVNPQLASIIRDDAVSVMSGPEDSHAACPTCSKMVAPGKAWPPATRVPVVYHLTPPSHIGPATIQVRTPTALTEVESILSEPSMAIDGSMSPRATGVHKVPSISCVAAPVPEEHTGMPTMLKKFESHETPTTTKVPVGLPIAPAVQAIIINCVTIVDPQLASII